MHSLIFKEGAAYSMHLFYYVKYQLIIYRLKVFFIGMIFRKAWNDRGGIIDSDDNKRRNAVMMLANMVM